MKRLLAATLISALFLAAADAARAQAGGKNQPPRSLDVVAPGAEVPVSQGRLEGGTYTNDFFGISFSIPQGWVAQDVAARQALLDKGKEIVGDGASEKKMEGFEAALKRTYFLLSTSKYDLTKPPPGFNAQMSFLAERVPTAVVKTGADYIALMLKTTEGTAAKVALNGPVRTEQVGGVTFTVADAKLTIHTAVAAQKYYVTVMKGYALMFSYTYVDEADAKAFADIVKSIKFK